MTGFGTCERPPSGPSGRSRRTNAARSSSSRVRLDLVHELTDDHDALNESIRDLTAGGWTNTGGGLAKEIDGNEINSRSANERRQTGEFTSRHGEDGVRVAADGGEEFRDIVATGRLDSATTDRLIRAYDRNLIDDADLERIARGLDRGEIDQSAVRTALTRVAALDDRGYDISALRTGQEANTRDPYYAVWYGNLDRGDLDNGEIPADYRPGDAEPGYDAPHDTDNIVIEAQAEQPQDYIRVHGENNQQGPWMMPEDEFTTVATRDGIDGLENEYALLGGAPEYATRVTVPEGESVRVSTVGSQGDLDGGGTQIEVRHFDSDLENGWFSDPVQLSDLTHD